MASALPILCKAVTVTSGTNNYTLFDPSSSTAYRTDEDAVGTSSLSDGDTVVYIVRDDTTTGPAAEWGYGVYTAATRTIARTAGNVIDSFDDSATSAHGGGGGPGTLLTWAASGQRDVYLVAYPLDARNNGSDVLDGDAFADNIGAARINAANIFDAQINRFQEQLQIFGSVAGAFLALRTDNQAAASAANKVRWRAAVNNSTPAARVALEVESSLSTVTAASEESLVELKTYTGGSQGTAIKIAGQTLQTGAGDDYDHFPGGGVTKMLFGTAPPAGWTRVNEGESRAIKLAESGDTVGGTGGSRDPFATSSSSSHTLTVAEIPSHTHSANDSLSSPKLYIDNATTGTKAPLGAGTAVALASATGAAGGDGSHSHNIPAITYRIATWATKD